MWFNHRRARLPTPTPYFAEILHNIVLQSYVLPHLPPPLSKLAYPQVHLPGPKTLTTASLGTAATSNTTVSGDVSALTAPTITTMNTRATQLRGTFQANLTPDSIEVRFDSDIRFDIRLFFCITEYSLFVYFVSEYSEYFQD
jgi:hypothetical protein